MKNVLLSTAYLIVLIIGLILFDLALTILLDEVIFKIMDWFNNQSWAIKILCFLFGGYLLYYTIMFITEFSFKLIGYYVYSLFPINAFTTYSLLVLCGINFLYLVWFVWQSIIHWHFWTVIEFIIVVLYIFSLHGLFMPDQKKIFKRNLQN